MITPNVVKSNFFNHYFLNSGCLFLRLTWVVSVNENCSTLHNGEQSEHETENGENLIAVTEMVCLVGGDAKDGFVLLLL